MQETAGQVFAATLSVGSFLLFGSSQSLTAGLLAKIIAYIRYLDIDYSPELKDLLQQESNLVALDLIPDLPYAIQKRIPSVSLPYMFEDYELEAPFLSNFWPNLFAIMIAFAIFLTLIALQKTISKHSQNRLARFINKCYFAALNFLIVQIYCSMDEITLFLILQMKFLSFESVFSYLSLLLSLFFTAIGLSSIGVHVWIIKKYQAIKNQSKGKNKKGVRIFLKKFEGLSLLFQDFKDTTFLHQSYLLIFIIRNIFANVLLGLLYEHPMVQTTFFVIFSILLLSYIIIKKPFIERMDLLEQIFYESIILATNISVFIMCIKQGNGTLAEAKEPLGKGIITMSLICNIGALSLVIIRLLALFYTTIKLWRNKKLNKKVAPTTLANDSKATTLQTKSTRRLNNRTKNNTTLISSSQTSHDVSTDLDIKNLNDESYLQGLKPTKNPRKNLSKWNIEEKYSRLNTENSYSKEDTRQSPRLPTKSDPRNLSREFQKDSFPIQKLIAFENNKIGNTKPLRFNNTRGNLRPRELTNLRSGIMNNDNNRTLSHKLNEHFSGNANPNKAPSNVHQNITTSNIPKLPLSTQSFQLGLEDHSNTPSQFTVDVTPIKKNDFVEFQNMLTQESVDSGANKKYSRRFLGEGKDNKRVDAGIRRWRMLRAQNKTSKGLDMNLNFEN